MSPIACGAAVGVDTHADTHVAAAIDHNGGVLGIESFPTNEAGYENLVGWIASFGPIERVGVEGTGSYGVGLARFLTATGIDVVEVDRPNRQVRRRKGSPIRLMPWRRLERRYPVKHR